MNKYATYHKSNVILYAASSYVRWKCTDWEYPWCHSGTVLTLKHPRWPRKS